MNNVYKIYSQRSLLSKKELNPVYCNAIRNSVKFLFIYRLIKSGNLILITSFKIDRLIFLVNCL